MGHTNLTDPKTGKRIILFPRDVQHFQSAARRAGGLKNLLYVIFGGERRLARFAKEK